MTAVVDDRPPRLLIVNADDYGLTDGISRGILTAHRDGIVTSTSVLAVAEAFERSVPPLRDTGLGVGVHLAVVGEDPPLLSSAEVPTLVDQRGGFRRSWRRLAAAIAGRRVDPDDLRREFDAQVHRVRGAGIVPTHLDTHQHVHLLPPVARVVLDVADAHGIRALRIPHTPAAGVVGAGVRALARRLRSASRRRGVMGPDAFLGLDESGHMGRAELLAALGAASVSAGRSVEIGVHPGTDQDPERVRFAWGFDWAAELAALRDPDVAAFVATAGFRLGTFADLPHLD